MKCALHVIPATEVLILNNIRKNPHLYSLQRDYIYSSGVKLNLGPWL